MYIKVGVYELNTSEEFKTENEAIARFLDVFPDANLEKVKAKVKPYFTKKDVNKSDNAQKENPDSDRKHAETGSRVVGKEQSGKDK